MQRHPGRSQKDRRPRSAGQPREAPRARDDAPQLSTIQVPPDPLTYVQNGERGSVSPLRRQSNHVRVHPLSRVTMWLGAVASERSSAAHCNTLRVFFVQGADAASLTTSFAQNQTPPCLQARCYQAALSARRGCGRANADSVSPVGRRASSDSERASWASPRLHLPPPLRAVLRAKPASRT